MSSTLEAREVEGYPDYLIYPDGRIWSKRLVKRGKFLKPMICSGYETVCLTNSLGRRNYRVHRLVAEAFLGKSELEVDHIDRNRFNNSFENLRYVTGSENCLNKEPSYRRRFVYLHRKNIYKANITVKRRGKQTNYYVGVFKDKEQAYMAAHSKFVELFGEQPWSLK